MRKVIYVLLSLIFSAAALSSVNVQRRISLFTQQSNAFRQICFLPDGTYQDGLVIYDPSTSVRNTAIDCNAQAIALNQERDAIEREIQSLGGADCSLEVQDSSLVDLLNGGTGIVDELNCPGIGSASQCAATMGCNMGLSVLSAIPAIGPIISRGAGNALRQQPALRDCGASGTNCFENIGASIGHVLYDTVTGICWLVTFGNACTGEEEVTPDPDGATRTRALAASTQSDQQVASFTSDPVGWVMNGVNAIINMVADAISRRYGCRQWSGAPFVSTCVLPMEWDCANCDQKLNMICGTLGYIGSEIIATVFTGGAAGGAEALVTGLRGVRAVAAVEEYVMASRAARVAGRIGSATARGLGAVWNGIANSRTVNALTSVASRVNTATRTVRIFAASQDAVIAAAVKYNELTEAAFRLGYNATSGARSRMLERLLRDMPKVEDIRNGLYAQQGIRTVEDYRRIATSRMSPADRARMRVIVTTDRPPRAVIVDTRSAAVDSEIRFDFNPERPAPAPQIAAVPAPAAVNAADEVTELEEIVVTAPRRRRETSQADAGIVVSSERAPVGGASITEGGLSQRAPAAEVRPVTGIDARNAVTSDITTGSITVRSSEGEDLLRRLGGEHVTFQDREIILDVVMGGPRKSSYLDEGGRFDEAFRTRYRDFERRLNQNPDELARYRTQVESLSRERVAAGNQRTIEELEDIRKNRLPVRDEAFNCANLSRLTPGAFPSEGGRCRKLRFDEDVNGRYCSCGGMGKKSFTWLVRCPTSATDYHQLATYVDELALPFDSAPEMCTRVDIPRGKECYIGPTSPTFAGFGGTTQILCENRPPRAPRGANGNPPTPEQVAAYEAQMEDIRRFGIQFGEPAVRPVRWAPFSTFTEYQNIVERAARACTNVCNINELAEIQRDFERATSVIRARANPAELERLTLEQRNFDQYLRELREGRKTYPTSGELSPATPAPVAVTDQRFRVTSQSRISQGSVPGTVTVRNAPDITLQLAGTLDDPGRIAAAERIIGNVSGNERRRDVLIRAHNVAPEHGFGTYTAAELREKTNILRYNMTTDELAAYRRANGNRYPTEIYTQREADEVLRRGLAGNNPADDFGEARSTVVRANDLSRDLMRSEGRITLDQVKGEYLSAARRYEAEALRTRSPQLTAESWALYAKSGDRQSAVRMIEAGVSNNRMNPQQVIQGIDRKLANLDRDIRATNPPNAALVLERDTLKAARDEAARKFTPNVATPGPTPAPTPTPRPQRLPVNRPAAIVVSEIPPSRAQQMANEFRSGTNGRVKDSQQAAELYYRASDGIIRRESQRTRNFASGGSQFMRDRNFGAAFEQSLQSDGALSIRMLDDIYAAGGSNGLNSFLAENFDRFNSRHPSQVARANIRLLIAHINERYPDSLFGPQKNYLRSWSSANFDEILPVNIPESTRAKIQNHVELTPDQSTYIDNLIQAKGDIPMGDNQINVLMNNASTYPGQPAAALEARPFRSENITSMFPEGVTPDDVIREYNRGNFRPGTRQAGTSSDLTPFEVEMNGNRYSLYVCTAPQCQVDGVTLTANQVRTVFPRCGRTVQAIMKLSRAKDVLRQPGSISRESFLEPLPCRD
jgi:hypothetical protein